jgi:hypothetical protein
MDYRCKCPFCKKPDWISVEDYIIELSKFLGYPKCCTKQYLKDRLEKKEYFNCFRTKAALRINKLCSFDAGFVPCNYHASKILFEKKNYKRIFRNRICSTAFPYASTEELKRYLKKIKKNYANNKAKN